MSFKGCVRNCNKGLVLHGLSLPLAALLIEPPHDKTSKMTVRPAKTQISLGIRQV